MFVPENRRVCISEVFSLHQRDALSLMCIWCRTKPAGGGLSSLLHYVFGKSRAGWRPVELGQTQPTKSLGRESARHRLPVLDRRRRPIFNPKSDEHVVTLTDLEIFWNLPVLVTET